MTGEPLFRRWEQAAGGSDAPRHPRSPRSATGSAPRSEAALTQPGAGRPSAANPATEPPGPRSPGQAGRSPAVGRGAVAPKRSGSLGAALRGSLVAGRAVVRVAVRGWFQPGGSPDRRPAPAGHPTGRPPWGFCFPRPRSGRATDRGHSAHRHLQAGFEASRPTHADPRRSLGSRRAGRSP